MKLDQAGCRKAVKRIALWSLLPLLVLLPAAARCAPQPERLSPAQAQALVQHALANELHAATDNQYPMRFELRKSTPRLTTTKKIIETSDGDVARLLSINGNSLNAMEEQKEESRLTGLLNHPDRQMSRKQSEQTDTARALKVLRVLPKAFLYQYIGPGQGPTGPVERYSFRPNPAFNPADMELHVLTALAGQLWIDPNAERVVRLDGSLQHGVDFGWGIIGHLSKGGTISVDQAYVGDHQWRTVRLKLQMTGRILFFSKAYDTLQEESHFVPVPNNLNYRDAIKMLRADP
jgi:hypothetical protein